MASGGFIDCSIGRNPRQGRSQKRDGDGGAVGLLQNAGGGAHIQRRLPLMQIYQPVIGVVSSGRSSGESPEPPSPPRPPPLHPPAWPEPCQGFTGSPNTSAACFRAWVMVAKLTPRPKVVGKCLHQSAVASSIPIVHSPIASSMGGWRCWRFSGVTLAGAWSFKSWFSSRSMNRK
jgi:hypothetical protein